MQRELRIMTAMAGALVLAGARPRNRRRTATRAETRSQAYRRPRQLRREPGGRGVELITQCSRVTTSAGTKEISGGPNPALRRGVPAAHARFHA